MIEVEKKLPRDGEAIVISTWLFIGCLYNFHCLFIAIDEIEAIPLSDTQKMDDEDESKEEKEEEKKEEENWCQVNIL